MNEPVVAYASRATEKVRRHGVAACQLSVFMHTSAHNSGPWYSNGTFSSLVEATSDMRASVSPTVNLADGVWRMGYPYAKARVILTELVPEALRQPALSAVVDRKRRRNCKGRRPA